MKWQIAAITVACVIAFFAGRDFFQSLPVDRNPAFFWLGFFFACALAVLVFISGSKVDRDVDPDGPWHDEEF